ncbi:hypothetical protein N0V90_001214 [Kalmusia sp. IMI 367209]|nr:hypothetical protein N0V90_001214 [Kalmusia sp. IMI 367209]
MWQAGSPDSSAMYPQRKTSIPIHFNFANAKRHSSAPNDHQPESIPPTPFPPPARPPAALLRTKQRPASILIPKNTPAHQQLPTAVQPQWTPVEISNFAPDLRHAELLHLLRDYNFSGESNLADTPQFTHPFRTTVMVAGVEEATRMVKNLNNQNFRGRQISVRLIISEKNGEEDVQDVADEMKIRIINTARVYHASLTNTILEVRELVQDGSHFAFLQKRAPITIHSKPEMHALVPQNKAAWEFVAGAAVDPTVGDGGGIPRLDALKNLQEHLERQGVLGKIWDRLDSSQMLEYNGA